MTTEERKQNEKEYGKVEYNGKTYILTQQAYCSNYGTDGGVRYYAHAVEDNDNNDATYKVVWDTTSEWDNHQSGGEEHPREYDDDNNEIYPNGMSCNFCEDESNACNWEEPVDVYEVD